ncbi:hypothetical protein F1643_04885 [Azospirillum sp. INR13]|uniref:hypothetical protein n=1 Tax=Azospirillum sp. INR13 TaxID=2596919 RepID=UPI001892138D|nr:hypothetical protein [Azospirillum sp. INR13]MBF5093920.1 hypothetical protein [Azospirillum sp. INR13]
MSKNKARLCGMGKDHGHAIRLALVYLIGASGMSFTAAYIEGRLFEHTYIINSKGELETVLPYILNISTIFDFFLLNPIVIYYITLSSLKAQESCVIMRKSRQISLYHTAGAAVLSLAIGIMTMKFYVGNFSGTYDATLIPAQTGGNRITLTGWIVFFWTTIFISALVYGCIRHGFYVAYIFSLDSSSLPYSPFHTDEAGGVKFLIDPAVCFMYAMMTLLLIFGVFALHDKIIFNIHDSNRLWGF